MLDLELREALCARYWEVGISAGGGRGQAGYRGERHGRRVGGYLSHSCRRRGQRIRGLGEHCETRSRECGVEGRPSDALRRHKGWSKRQRGGREGMGVYQGAARLRPDLCGSYDDSPQKEQKKRAIASATTLVQRVFSDGTSPLARSPAPASLPLGRDRSSMGFLHAAPPNPNPNPNPHPMRTIAAPQRLSTLHDTHHHLAGA